MLGDQKGWDIIKNIWVKAMNGKVIIQLDLPEMKDVTNQNWKTETNQKWDRMGYGGYDKNMA